MILTEYTLPAPGNPGSSHGGSFRIALITDLHERNITETLELLKLAQPDIIAVAGDTFERRSIGDDTQIQDNLSVFEKSLNWLALKLNDLYARGERKRYDPDEAFRFIREVSRIEARDGKTAHVYMSLGNHEWRLEERDRQVLSKARITLLDNDYVELDGDLAGLCIGGLSTVVDVKMLDEFSKETGYKILLCHHPEYYEKYLRHRNIDLILSGHAHGGQIRIFGHGILSPSQGLFPKYHHGVYENRLVVSSGCTNTAAIPRWGNPCEVVVIELVECVE